MKNLGFSDALVPLVLDGTKRVTRRGLSALKRYKVGDVCYVGEALVLGAAGEVHYRRDGAVALDPLDPIAPGCVAAWRWKTRVMPSIWCPGWAARGFIRVTDLRAERLQDITDEDAILEGVASVELGAAPHTETYFVDPGVTEPVHYSRPRDCFLYGMWVRINGAKSLKANPELARIAIELVSPDEARSAA